jgi:hypothetical protein
MTYHRPHRCQFVFNLAAVKNISGGGQIQRNSIRFAKQETNQAQDKGKEKININKP